MRKLLWFFILLPIIVISLLVAYIFMPSLRYPIGDFFGGVTPLVVAFFQTTSAVLVSLPTGLWTILLLGLVLGIFVDRYAHSIWFSMRRRMVFSTYSDAGFVPQSNVGLSQGMVSTQTQPQSTVVVPPVMKLEDE